MPRLLEVSKLEKKMEEFHLGPINLTIEPGTITALVGNNGSGKSTLLKLIMNLVQPTKGTIQVNNLFVDAEHEDWKQFIAYQPQTIVGWDAFTGNMLKELISPLYPNWDEQLFLKMIELFQIPLDKKFAKLSQGGYNKS